ncbi:hypothetical protein GDO86_011317 [Hymenochirus boettgeri]|uniref:Uncharacterized protein n=1 Tax=Hymenochirus boettgeri TaxID=247094 RepID=A0A8T2JJ23_9PIPI|nr:hypothetical protein GDO86_011317 [Hymenochirus boettgeri]
MEKPYCRLSFLPSLSQLFLSNTILFLFTSSFTFFNNTPFAALAVCSLSLRFSYIHLVIEGYSKSLFKNKNKTLTMQTKQSQCLLQGCVP